MTKKPKLTKKTALTTPHDSFFYRKGKLTVDGILLEDLTSKYGSPLYVYSGKAIRASYRNLKSVFSGMPVQIHYAVKANSNIQILKLLNTLGAGCDLVSYGEWYRAEKAGIPRERRVLSGVAKLASEFESLFKLKRGGVYSIHVESAMEFELIVMMANAMKRNVSVAFRYNPDVDAKTLDKISTGRKQDKFGLTREEILDLVINYGDDHYVKIAGLSIHIGSQIVSLTPFDQAFKNLQALQFEVELHLGRPLEYIDLGGGIGVQYLNEKTLDLKGYAALVRKYFKDTKKILLEPGRSLMANAGVLLTEVVYSKERATGRTLILDSGMNDLVRPALYDAYHGILPVQETKEKPLSWDVVGGICETTDYFARGRKLAVEGLPGEQLAILSSGAYGFSMSSSYNTRPRVAEILVDQGKVRLIRKRETLDDLLRGEI
jgi:diaminopimelate decarboxylase